MDIIRFDENASTQPLYKRYENEFDPQPAYISLDCEEETLSADYDPNFGGCSPKQFHGIEQTFGISPYMRRDDINALLDRIAPLAETVINGFESRWNGNNFVASFDDEALGAIEEIRELCDSASEDCLDTLDENDEEEDEEEER